MDICEKIGVPAALEQCAEECAELGQACLKLARKLRNENPTPKSVDKLKDNLTEEMGDVMACMAVLATSNCYSVTQADKIADEKMDRWDERIKNNKKKKEN